MHREAWEFIKTVKAQAPEFFTGKKVLEVGSLNINGSVRDFFTNCDYFGIDLGAGKDVDQVIHLVEFADRNPLKFDVVISAEALEHDSRWDKSIATMYALLKSDGILIITAAAPNRPEHGTTRSPDEAIASPHTPDYYRNISTEDFASVLPANLFSKSHLGYRGQMEDLYFVGIKVGLTKFPDIDTMSIVPKSLSEQIREEWHKALDKPKLPNLTVTAEVCTKDRATTTLPACLSAIIHQTHKPQWVAIYSDGELTNMETVEPFKGLLQMANDLGINWTVFDTPKWGQVASHQHALDNASTQLLWRIDDDEIPEPNCLENLLAEMKDGVGAVGGLVHHPGGIVPLPDFVDGSLNDVTRGTNISWYSFNSGPREVQHLYSTFLMRVESARKAGGYCKELSVVGHREETMLSNSIFRAGYKLIVTPRAKTWHLRQSSGGIRSYSDVALWEHDEVIFQEYLRTVGHVKQKTKLIILDVGLGDALCFRGVFVDYIRRRYPDRHYTLAVCQPEVFEELENVTIISIAEAKLIVGDKYEDYSLFAWCWKNNWKGSIVDAMKEFYA